MEIKPIPGTLGFKASEDGIIYGPDGEIRNQYVNGDGYRTASVKLLDGRWQTFGVHRLVALALLKVDGDVSRLTVNHIDHDIGHNHVDNLEWVSAHLNNLHASLMRQQVDRPTLILSDANGQKSFINNLHDASAVLGVDVDLAWEMVRDDREIDGRKLSALTTKGKIPLELVKPKFIDRDAYGRAVEVMVTVRDLETGLCEKFDSIADAALRHQVSPSHVCQCISQGGKKRLFKKRYQIVRGLDPFPDLTSEEWEELKSPGGKETIAYNSATQQTMIFESASGMIESLGLSKKAVTTRLKRDGFGEIGEWFFCYKKHLQTLKDRIKEFQLT